MYYWNPEVVTTPVSWAVKDHFADATPSQHLVLPHSLVSCYKLTSSVSVLATEWPLKVAQGYRLVTRSASSLVSEVMTRVADFQDKLATFVSILESRNKELAETLRSAHQGLASSQTLLLHITNMVWDMKETKLDYLLQGGKRKETRLLISMWPSSDRSTEPHHQHGILSPSASTSD